MKCYSQMIVLSETMHRHRILTTGRNVCLPHRSKGLATLVVPRIRTEHCLPLLLSIPVIMMLLWVIFAA